MRLPRVRVRTLIAAVVLTPFMCWCALMGLRSYVYYQRAERYAAYERGWLEISARAHGWARHGADRADHYRPLARKYRRAMWHPWEPVEPDPPPPGYRMTKR